MKKLVIPALVGLLCLAMCACAGEKEPFDPGQTAQALLEEPGVFSEELEPVEQSIWEMLYGVQEGDGVTEGVCYCSTGSTAEEVAVFRFAGEAEAEAFEAKAQEHIAYQKESNETYRPQEMPKLEKALVERRGDTLLVLVCADQDSAQALLD